MTTTLAATATDFDANHYRDFAAHFTVETEGVTDLFTTTANENLFAAYLNALPEEERQAHTCNACRRFIETFGGLVAIDEQGRQSSPIWETPPSDPMYAEAFSRMAHIVRRSPVTGVFRSSEKVWGTPKNHDGKRHRDWHHLAVTPPPHLVYPAGAWLTPHQAMAEKKEDFRIINTALQEFDLKTVQQALHLLQTESLYRSEKVIGPAQFLSDLHSARAAVQGQAARDNLTWLAVARAPAGFCHPRSSMVGTLLEDIAAGLPFDDVAAKFKAKMHPLAYQRPQAAPSAGAIAQAEQLVEHLGFAPALRRRFARLDEVVALWKPAEAHEAPKAGGVFAHLTPKESQPVKAMDMPAITMTWEKFQRTVLPEAVEIEYFVRGREIFTHLVTAADPDAPPILQWDSPEQRNPCSLYLWSGGQDPVECGLQGGTWHKVTAITYRPHMWHDPAAFPHQHKGALFLLQGAKDHRKGAGLALFPETLRSELHAVRAVIEAYSRRGELEGFAEASATGVLIDNNRPLTNLLRVTVKGGHVTQYKLDRWD